MFYDPMECRPFYQDEEAPIWYGRVEDMHPHNQRIFVYGFITSPPNEDIEFDKVLQLEYSMQMRAKDSLDEEW